MSERVRYRLMVSKNNELVLGPPADEAVAEITAPVAVVTAAGFDAAEAYMRGKISATGHIGTVLETVADGRATQALLNLASQL